MSFDIKKVIFHENKIFPIHDFGIYNFFRYSDNVNKAKFIATVLDNKYIVAIDLSDKIAHWQLVEEISEKFGEFDFNIGSLGDEIYVWKAEKLTEAEFEVILKILEVFKQYVLDTGLQKSVEFSCDEFIDELKGAQSSDNIDRVIEVVKKKFQEFKEQQLSDESNNSIKVAI